MSMPFLITEYDLSPVKFGLISGTVNILFWIFILLLVFEVFMTSELKKYMKLLIPLVILVIAITRGNELGKLIWGNLNHNVKSEVVPEITSYEFNMTQPNKVYISSDYENETIDPEKYNATGKLYSIFIYNKTTNSIRANEKITIRPNESYVFKIPDTLGISLDNGIQFFFGETEGLEVIDNNIQVSGLGGEWLNKLNVPESTDYAFSIVNVGQGDPIPEE
jgi:hypothetical protein